MRPDLRESYVKTVKTADRVLAADKLLVDDLRNEDIEGVGLDAEIMVMLLRRWLGQMTEYKNTVEDMLKDVYDELETAVPADKVHAAYAHRGTRVH